MTNEAEKMPPAGGADLECIFACKNLQLASAVEVLDTCAEYGFRPRRDSQLSIYGADAVVPDQEFEAGRLHDIVSESTSDSARRLIANLDGTLVDTPTPMGVVLDLEWRVVSLGIPEDALWGFGEDTSLGDFRKLQVFAECCRGVSSALCPQFGYLGTEGPHAVDIATEPEDHGAYHTRPAPSPTERGL